MTEKQEIAQSSAQNYCSMGEIDRDGDIVCKLVLSDDPPWEKGIPCCGYDDQTKCPHYIIRPNLVENGNEEE